MVEDPMRPRARSSSAGIAALLVAGLAALGFGALGFGARGACVPPEAAAPTVQRTGDSGGAAHPTAGAPLAVRDRRSDRLDLEPAEPPGDAPVDPHVDPSVARRSALRVEVQGFVLLPDGTPAAGETVEVSIELHALVIERFIADAEGSFAGSLALPYGATPESRAVILGKVQSERGYASGGIRGESVSALLEKPYELELRMRRIMALSGQLVDSGGEPAWPASMYLYEARDYDDPSGKSINRSTLSNRPDGRFTTTLGSTGRFVLQIQADLGAACHSFEIAALDEHVDLGRIVVEPGEAELFGVVIAGHGAPLAALPLRATLADGRVAGSASRDHRSGPRLPAPDCGRGRVRAWASTDAEGRFRMRGLAAGTFELDQQGHLFLGRPEGTFATGIEHGIVLSGFPFEVLVQDRDGAGVASVEVTVTGSEKAVAEPRTLTTDAEGLVFVPWREPGEVLVQVDGGHGEPLDTHFVVPAAGQTSLPRCTLTTDAGPGTGVISVQVGPDLDVALPPVRVHVRRQGSGELVHLQPVPGEPALLLDSLAAGTYTVVLRHEGWAGPHFVLPAEDLSRVVELQDGGREHVSFQIRLGGRVRVRLEGDRREAGAYRWSVQRLEPDGAAAQVSLLQHLETGGAQINRYLDFDSWWILEPVFEPGPHDLELLRDDEPFTSRRFHVHPGELQDWVIRVTDRER